ncbi:MAG: S-layer homology domain-containing protein [Bifidobacteriaceae bacterium]|jgi:hypothetical protein|nr:S-layer homology domain-containing protein [Bifidobacteriaceae bacterium]
MKNLIDFINRILAISIIVSLGFVILLIVNITPVMSTPAAQADKLTNLPPSPRNVGVIQSDLKSLQVNWQAPASPPVNYTYTIELYNNVNVIAVAKTGIPQTDTEYLFTNLFAANYIATKVYTVSDDGVSQAGVSNTVIHNSLNGLDNFVNFKDTSKLPQIAQDDIAWAQSYNIAHGFPDNNFYPAKNTTRAQMATFMRRLAGFPVITKSSINFIDIAKNKHKGDIEWLASEGISLGYNCSGKAQPVKECTQAGVKVFRPESFITREQMAIFMYQFAKAPIITAGDNLQLTRFKDSNNLLSSMAKTAVSWLVRTKLTAGYPDGNFKASTKVTRQQMVVFLQSLAAELSLMPYLSVEADYPSNFLNTGLIRNNITKIAFIRSFPQCDAPVDISYNKFNGLKACVNGTELIIGEPAGVMANPQNSKYLFANIGWNNTNASQFDFSYFNASKTKNMSYIFYYANLPAGFTMSDGFGLSALDLQYAFYSIKGRGDIILPAGFGGLATNMYNMFAYIGSDQTAPPYLLHNLYLPQGFGANVINIDNIFEQSRINNKLDLPTGFASYVTGMRSCFTMARIGDLILPAGFGAKAINVGTGQYLFQYLKANKLSIPSSFAKNGDGVNLERLFEDVNISQSFVLPTGFAANSSNISAMFQTASLPAGFILPKDFGKNAAYIGYGNLFANTIFLGAFNISDGVLSNQTNLYGIFSNATFNAGLTIPDNFASNATNLQFILGNAKFLGPLTIGSGFASRATNISNIFNGTQFFAGVVLPTQFGSMAQNMNSLFQGAILNGDIDWSGTNLSISTATKTNMFTGTVWNGHFILAQNQASVNWLIDNTGAAAANVKVKGK